MSIYTENLKMEKRCAELVLDKFKERAAEIEGVYRYYDLDEAKRSAHVLHNQLSGDWAGEALENYGLDFSYVAPDDFTITSPLGYYRWQLSWGGPSDEFRIYVDNMTRPVRVEYWFTDWFDWAKVDVNLESYPYIEAAIAYFLEYEFLAYQAAEV
jgi:hypothetical protein